MAFKYKQPSLVRFILSIALILSSFVVDIICFTPPPRFSQASALIGDKIYYMGGFVPLPQPIISDFFYLDTSILNSTDSATLPWTQLTGLDNLFTSSGTAVAGGANKDLFVLFGGQMTPDNSSLVIVYDTNSNKWSRPASQGPLTRREQTQAVIDGSGKMYIFGGSTGEAVPTFLNDMIILDTVDWSWSVGTKDGAPEPRNGFTATILKNGVIVYIGGSNSNNSNNSNNRYVSMSQINMYDTNSATWVNTEATGDAPTPRSGHSAVLTSDERIIIYGGAFLISTDGKYTPAIPALAVLETSNNNFVWSVPKAGGTNPPPIAYHSATLVGNNMIVSFGNITSKEGPSSSVYVLNTKNNSNYEWVTSVVPETVVPVSSNKKSNVGKLVGIIAAVCGLIIILGGGLFWFYRYRKNKKMMDGVIETPGEFTDAGFTRRYETMNSTTTSQISSASPTLHVNPEIEDDRDFRVLPQELQPEYLEKKFNV